MKKALIVEDDHQNRNLFSLLSKAQDCTVDSVADGLEALDQLLDNSYDLIILDLRMPRMSGHDLLVHLRDYKQEMLDRTIVVSACNEKELRALAAEYGIPVFRKPFDLREVGESIRERLGY